MDRAQKERYESLQVSYEKDGFATLSFLDVYILYCDRNLYYAGSSPDEFTKKLEEWLFTRISSASDTELLSYITQIKMTDSVFPSVFVAFFFKSKRHLDLHETTLDQILSGNLIPVTMLLKNKEFVSRFEQSLKYFLLGMENAISLWVAKYEQGTEYYLPKMDEAEIEAMILKYLSSSHRNPAELSLLENHKNSKGTYIISPLLRDKVRKAHTESLNDPNIVVFEGAPVEWETGMDDQMAQPYFEGFQGDHYRMVSSLSFVDKNNDLIGLQAILRDAIGLFDRELRLCDIYNPFLDDGLTTIFEHRTKGQYGGDYFREREQLRISHFHSVADHLQRVNASMESRLEETVKSIAAKDGKPFGFKIVLFPGHAAISRAEGVFNEIESLAKQYYLLREYGSLSDDLFRDTLFPGFEGLKSKDRSNYLELSPDTKALFVEKALFADEPYFPNLKMENGKYPNLLEALKEMRFKKEDFSLMDVDHIEKLVEAGVLTIQDDGLITAVDPKEIGILLEVFNRLFVPRRSIPDRFLNSAASLINKGLLTWTDGLFSKQEIEFVNYYMTDKCPRAASLRNKYQHGASFSVKEAEAINDYYAGLRILCALIYKIKDEVERWN